MRQNIRHRGEDGISPDFEKDTPWDEPTVRSHEFSRYVSGTFIDDAPWDRIPAAVFCALRSFTRDAFSLPTLTLGSSSDHGFARR